MGTGCDGEEDVYILEPCPHGLHIVKYLQRKEDNMKRSAYCRYGNESCFPGIPNGTDLYVAPGDCKVQANIRMNHIHGTVICGIVTDNRERTAGGTAVRLLKYCDRCSGFRVVACTYTDHCGYYQFELEQGACGRYRVIADPFAHCEEDFCEEPFFREQNICGCHELYEGSCQNGGQGNDYR